MANEGWDGWKFDQEMMDVQERPQLLTNFTLKSYFGGSSVGWD